MNYVNENLATFLKTTYNTLHNGMGTINSIGLCNHTCYSASHTHKNHVTTQRSTIPLQILCLYCCTYTVVGIMSRFTDTLGDFILCVYDHLSVL